MKKCKSSVLVSGAETRCGRPKNHKGDCDYWPTHYVLDLTKPLTGLEGPMGPVGPTGATGMSGRDGKDAPSLNKASSFDSWGYRAGPPRGGNRSTMSYHAEGKTFDFPFEEVPGPIDVTTDDQGRDDSVYE